MLLIAARDRGGGAARGARALDTHRDTIEVIHMLGATDIQIARLFQRRIALDALLGGLVGTAGAHWCWSWFAAGTAERDRIGDAGRRRAPAARLVPAAAPADWASRCSPRWRRASTVLRALGKML